MKITLNTITVLFALLLICSCSNPQKLYDKGNYEKAYAKALGNLKKGKKKRSDLQVLNSSFERFMDEKMIDITRLNKGNLKDQEKAYTLYGQLFDRYEDGRIFIYDDIADAVDGHYEDSADLAMHLSDTYAESATRKLRQSILNENKIDAQTAYYQFDKAIFYDKKDQYVLDSLQEVAKEKGTVYYSVDRASIDGGLGWEIDRIFDDIESDASSIFTVVNYGLDDNEVDCAIELRFSDLSQYDDSDVDSKDFDERVITGYNTEVDTSGNKTETPIYDEVSGTVRINRVKRITEIALIVDLDAYSHACDFSDGRLRAESYEEREFYELYGDERAIPDKYKSRKTDDFTDPRDIAEDLLEELYRDFERMFN